MLKKRANLYMNDHLRKYQAQIDEWFEPRRQLQEQMIKWLEPQRQLVEQMVELLEPQCQLEAQMTKLFELQHKLEKQEMVKLFESQRQLEAQMARRLEPELTFQNNIEKWEPFFKVEKDITDILGKVEKDNITVNQEGTISIEGDIVAATEFTEVYSDFLDAIKHVPSPTQAILFIGDYAQKLKRPISTLLVILIIPYLLTITSNLTTLYLKNG